MELEHREQNAGHFARGWSRIKSLAKGTRYVVVRLGKSLKSLGKEDPRRIIHSIKFGLALTLASLLYYIRPLYDEYGVSGMWAVVTVVSVFEFTVGGTLSRCTSIGCATFIAAALCVGALRLVSIFTEVAQPIAIGVLVFLIAAVATFTRFSPMIKARYDYGVLIFILTFASVSVSGYRCNELLELARQRILTILIGGAICIIVSICLCPVWAGEDLHNMIAIHMEKLALSLEGFGSGCFECEEKTSASTLIDDNTPVRGFEDVLVSKTTEEVLANFARWEFCHGQFQFFHPWEPYLKIACLVRKCTYHVDALGDYVNSDLQASTAFKERIKYSCVKICFESSKALKIFSRSMKSMMDPSPANIHIENSSNSVKELESTLKEMSFDDSSDLSTIVPSAAATATLAQVVNCVKNISEAVHEIAQSATFMGVVKSPSLHEHVPQTLHRSRVAPIGNSEECISVVVVKENDFIIPGN